jgi:hypothetical protein
MNPSLEAEVQSQSLAGRMLGHLKSNLETIKYCPSILKTLTTQNRLAARVEKIPWVIMSTCLSLLWDKQPQLLWDKDLIIRNGTTPVPLQKAPLEELPRVAADSAIRSSKEIMRSTLMMREQGLGPRALISHNFYLRATRLPLQSAWLKVLRARWAEWEKSLIEEGLAISCIRLRLAQDWLPQWAKAGQVRGLISLLPNQRVKWKSIKPLVASFHSLSKMCSINRLTTSANLPKRLKTTHFSRGSATSRLRQTSTRSIGSSSWEMRSIAIRGSTILLINSCTP